jgi:hypothetical protein
MYLLWLLLSLLGLDRQIQAICDIKGQILHGNLVSGPPDLTIRREPAKKHTRCSRGIVRSRLFLVEGIGPANGLLSSNLLCK